MQEIPFSLPVSGVVRIEEGSITVTINKTETIISFQPPKKSERISLGKGRTVFDIVLETASEVVRRTYKNRFSAAQLYRVALERYPQLKRNSWVSYVIASAPNHTSHQHFGTKRDYLRYFGNGSYSLNPKYMGKNKSDDPDKE